MRTTLRRCITGLSIEGQKSDAQPGTGVMHELMERIVVHNDSDEGEGTMLCIICTKAGAGGGALRIVH
jgi:hypothetical protein